MRFFFKYLIPLGILSYAQYSFAQPAADGNSNSTSTPSSKIFILPAYASLKSVTWRDSIYRFPSFEDGRISFETGYSPVEKMKFNYNLYFGQMDYIDNNGDTVQVVSSKELRMIKINKYSFLHDYNFGYIEIILQLPVALGVQEIFSDEGQSNGAPYSGVGIRGVPCGFARFYSTSRRYYFISLENKAYPSKKSTVLKLFNDHKRQIQAYLVENNIDFERENDLIKLLTFCNQLDQKNQE